VLRDKLIETTEKIGVYDQLSQMRDRVHPAYRPQRVDDQKIGRFIQSVLREDSSCIDVGAYRGRLLARMVHAAPLGRHIAYEPLPHEQRLVAERFPLVDVRQAAVSNQIGTAIFTHVIDEPSLSGFHAGSVASARVHRFTVRTETLDQCLPIGYIPTLIKISVEGAELQVFQGAAETITRYKPVIVFEQRLGRALRYGTQPHHIYELLNDNAGLEIFDLDGRGPYSLAEFEDSFYLDECWDYVARAI
jgi:FkbM family methyltransferase